MTDPYKVLGVKYDATDDEIKKAYRTLSRQYHPDANMGKSEAAREAAEEQFKNVQQAYDQIMKDREMGIHGSAYENGGSSYGGGYGSQSASGWGYYGNPFGGGSGAGVKIEPVSFVVIHDGIVRVLSANTGEASPIEKLADMLPGLIEKVKEYLPRKNEEKEET